MVTQALGAGLASVAGEGCSGMATAMRSRVQRPANQLRLQTTVRLRWIAVIGQTLALLGVHFGLGFQVPIYACLGVVGISAGLNAYLHLRYPARHHLSLAVGTGLLLYDVMQLAVLLYLTGGLQNPFAFLLVAPVTAAAATLPVESTLLVGIVSMLAAGALIRFSLPMPWYAGEVFELPLVYRLGIWGSIASGVAFMGLYARRLAKEARQNSEALQATEMVLAREQRLHALDGLAAAAAHELGTPLSTIALVSKELELSLPKDSPHLEDVALLRSQALRCREILKRLSQRDDENDPLHVRLPLSHLIAEAIEPFEVFEKSIDVTAAPRPDAAGPAAEEPITERWPGLVYGLTNIIENAVDFASSKVDIHAEWDADLVIIVITDDGTGFLPSIMRSIGDPYVTSRPSRAGPGQEQVSEERHGTGGGLGLGFFMARTLLERSGASIELANRTPPERGAVVRISWPRAAFVDPHGYLQSDGSETGPDRTLHGGAPGG